MTIRSKKVPIRNMDPNVVEISSEEYAAMVRNYQRFDWASWIKIFLMLFIPIITMITFLNNTDSRVTIVEKSVARNEKMIQDYMTSLDLLRSDINKNNVNQGIILEKITRAQKDIELLTDIIHDHNTEGHK